MKVCGVAVARLQGHSWAPTLLNGWRVNVGTIPLVPRRPAARWPQGKVRCRLMPVGWGGGPVYYSKTAVGIHEGEYLVGFGMRDMWSSLAYLEDALR